MVDYCTTVFEHPSHRNVGEYFVAGYMEPVFILVANVEIKFRGIKMDLHFKTEWVVV